MTGLWPFEVPLPYQKYQRPPIVVRCLCMCLCTQVRWWLSIQHLKQPARRKNSNIYITVIIYNKTQPCLDFILISFKFYLDNIFIKKSPPQDNRRTFNKSKIFIRSTQNLIRSYHNDSNTPLITISNCIGKNNFGPFFNHRR